MTFTYNESEALRRGDEAAFDAVFRQYYGPLCGYAQGLTQGDPDEAEDLVQQTFVKLWEKRTTLDINWSVKAYLYKMVHNAALNRIRHQQIQHKYQQSNAHNLEQAHDNPQDSLPELRERFQKALNILPPQCRRVFELNRFEELKYREIADLLQISVKTVETQMGKALKIMRIQLADYLVSIVGISLSFTAYIQLL